MNKSNDGNVILYRQGDCIVCSIEVDGGRFIGIAEVSSAGGEYADEKCAIAAYQRAQIKLVEFQLQSASATERLNKKINNLESGKSQSPANAQEVIYDDKDENVRYVNGNKEYYYSTLGKWLDSFTSWDSWH